MFILIMALFVLGIIIFSIYALVIGFIVTFTPDPKGIGNAPWSLYRYMLIKEAFRSDEKKK